MALDHSENIPRKKSPAVAAKNAKRFGGKVRETILTVAERVMWALARFPPSGAIALIPRKVGCGQCNVSVECPAYLHSCCWRTLG